MNLTQVSILHSFRQIVFSPRSILISTSLQKYSPIHILRLVSSTISSKRIFMMPVPFTWDSRLMNSPPVRLRPGDIHSLTLEQVRIFENMTDQHPVHYILLSIIYLTSLIWII